MQCGDDFSWSQPIDLFLKDMAKAFFRVRELFLHSLTLIQALDDFRDVQTRLHIEVDKGLVRVIEASWILLFQHIHHLLDHCKLFPVILTDRGSEFSNPVPIEQDENGELRSLVFYCNPSAPYQKGGIEVAHELIRRILPKGKSFDDLQQEDIDLMLSHINSYKRGKLNSRSAHQLFSFIYGDDILPKLNIREIEPNDIVLSPKLLKK